MRISDWSSDVCFPICRRRQRRQGSRRPDPELRRGSVMLNRDKVRYQLFLEPRLAERLEEMAAQPGVARSDILVAALDAWLKRQGSNELDERFGPRLDRMSLQIGSFRERQSVGQGKSGAVRGDRGGRRSMK